jgi:hypothetical protein
MATQQLKTDSLYYDRGRFAGNAYNGFVWIDSTMGIEIHATRGDYYDEQKKMYAYQNAFAIYKMDDDSLFIAGDTLYSQEHSATDSTKEFSVYHHALKFLCALCRECAIRCFTL